MINNKDREITHQVGKKHIKDKKLKTTNGPDNIPKCT